jgi:folate-dependent phosphoribosylglycinamide formyltransferase PurN
MRTAVICSKGNVFNREVLPRYLASISDLVGIVAIEDRPRHLLHRLRHEWRRSRWRIVDVLAFRLFYRARLGTRDRDWIRTRAAEELDGLPQIEAVPVHETDDPSSAETRAFLESLRPDLAVAACKTLLKPEIFNVPPHGTFVVHPGICPEYRNAHGCFWALARRDLDRVGATLLRIDEGVDTGPIYAYYRTDIDERAETHTVIQLRVVYDNLDQIGRDLRSIFEGRSRPIDVARRPSATWGQPRLTDYLRWKRTARRIAAA